MAVLDIITWPAKVLETRCKEVTEFDDKLRQFVQDMHDTMDKFHGIGLAANQVNELKRVLITYIPHDDCSDPSCGEGKSWWHNKRFTFINPVIVKKLGKIKGMEGCLSFPEIYEWVDRAERVIVKAQDINGKEFEIEADGLFAVCLQHEIDHLDGVVFINRMSRLKANLVRKKIQKRTLLDAKKQEVHV